MLRVNGKRKAAMRKGWAGLGLAAMIVVGWAAVASAHVTIQPSTATQGGYTAVAFRVPNEKDVPTVGLKVKFPDDHPFAAARVKPVPGWTAKITTKKLTTPIKTDDGDVTEGVDTIEWTGGQIAADEYQEFPVSLGPLPTDTTSLTFPAIQSYSDGTTVDWIDKPTTDGSEAEHPAPTLTLTPAATATGTDAHGAGTTPTSSSSSGEQMTATATPVSTETTSSSSNAVAWVGVGLGAVALILAAVAVARSGSKPTAT